MSSVDDTAKPRTAPIPWPDKSSTALYGPDRRMSSTRRSYPAAAVPCCAVRFTKTVVPLRAVSRSAPSSWTSSPAPPSASRRYIWSRSNLGGATLTYSSNTRVSSRPSSEAESIFGSTLSSITGLIVLPLYSADGRPVSELLAAPSSTSTSGAPVKSITAWRACSPRRTVSSVLDPSVTTADGECLTCGASDEYTAMRDVSTSDAFIASVKLSATSPVPRSRRASSSVGRLVTISGTMPLRAGRSFAARSSNAPAAVKSTTGDEKAAAAAFCASVSATTAVLASEASASCAPPSATAGAEPVALRMRMLDSWTSPLAVLTSSSNVMYSRPRSRFKSTFTAAGSVLSVPLVSRISCTPLSRYPVTAAYVEAPTSNVATPLAPLSISKLLFPPESSHACVSGVIRAGLLIPTICTPLQNGPVWPVLPSDSHVTIARGSPLCVNRLMP